MTTISKEEYDKLIDCKYNVYGEWRKAKFMRRGLSHVIVVISCRSGEYYTVRKCCFDVMVNDVRLDYISKHSFTNPKNPFTALPSDSITTEDVREAIEKLNQKTQEDK